MHLLRVLVLVAPLVMPGGALALNTSSTATPDVTQSYACGSTWEWCVLPGYHFRLYRAYELPEPIQQSGVFSIDVSVVAFADEQSAHAALTLQPQRFLTNLSDRYDLTGVRV